MTPALPSPILILVTETIDHPLSREEAILRLRALEPELRSRGVDALYLFGSTSRDEAGSDSDVDVFGDLDPDRRFGLDYFGLKFVIQDAIGRPTDFMSRDGIHPLLRQDIEASAVRVF